MEFVSFDAPALYGDHHVTEVRQILLALEGISEVYASSAFHVIEVKFDPTKINSEQITGRLEETGYLEEITVPVETGIAVEKRDSDGNFRHTAVYETVKTTVSFAQRVNYNGRPLWHCPGLGTVKTVE